MAVPRRGLAWVEAVSRPTLTLRTNPMGHRVPRAHLPGSVARVTVETAPTRQPTAVDALADEYFDAAIALSPTSRPTWVSRARRDIDDLSPAGFDAHVDLARRTLERLSEVEPTDAIDEVTIAAMRERLGLKSRRPTRAGTAPPSTTSPPQCGAAATSST